MHKAPPPMPDTSKLKGWCGLQALAILAVPAALIFTAVKLF